MTVAGGGGGGEGRAKPTRKLKRLIKFNVAKLLFFSYELVCKTVRIYGACEARELRAR